MTRRLPLALALLPLLAVPAARAGSRACPAGSVVVDLPNYSPATKTVAAGTAVTFCWTGGPHSVTDDAAGGYDSGQHDAGFTTDHTVNATFHYHCTVHSTMHGTIVVQASATPTPSRSPSPTRTAAPTPSRSSSRTAAPTPSKTPSPTPSNARPATSAPSPSPPETTAPAATPTGEPSPAAATGRGSSRTGLAVAVGLVVAALGIGGASLLYLRGRG